MLRATITTLGAMLVLSLAPQAALGAGLADRVDVFAGTQPGAGTFGGGHNFPGATMPFGMVQWGPDTVPADRHSGGYDYRDRHVSGFSLTHLSGAGCALYGDLPFLPTTEPMRASPAAPGGGLGGRFQPGFSHANERAGPGFYSTRLNPVGGGAIDAALTATTRTGMARFTFPRSPHASVLIDAGGSAKANDLAEVRIDPSGREISGSASSGYFCAQRPRYRIYFAAVFDRPFDAYGTWTRQTLAPGSTVTFDQKRPSNVAAETAQAGAYASFDTERNRAVTVRVGVSFVSVDAARANLAAESRGTSFRQLAATAEADWNRALASIRVDGGRRGDTETFYTALYHALLAPRTFDDADGRYTGMDGAIHDAGDRTQYADLSGWDIYRTQIPLLAMLMPHRASDIVASMLASAAQSGCLPRWSYANGQSMTMVGDPADAIIASAAAFGARRFNAGAALAAMVKGADEGCSSPDGDLRPAPGPRAVQGAGLRALRPRRQASQRQLVVRRPQRSLGFGGDHARVRDRRLLDRPVRGARSRRSEHLPLLHLALGQLAQSPQSRAATRSSRASKTVPSSLATTTCAAPASPRATRSSTPGWCPTILPGSSLRSVAAPTPSAVSTASCASSTAALAPRTPTMHCSATSPT